MPLSKPLTELLATLKDDNAQKILTEHFEKFPQLQDRFAGNLRQEDYDRQLNANKVALQQVETARDQLQKRTNDWQTWADKNLPIHKQLLESHAAIVAERDTLQEQVRQAAEAASAGGDEMVNKAELLSIVNGKISEFTKSHGAPSKDQITQIVAQEAARLGSEIEKKFLQETFPASMNTVLQTANLQMKYFKEFGDVMDPMAFMQLMADRGAASPTPELYEEFVRPLRDKQNAESHKQEIKDAVDAAVKQTISQMHVPGSSTIGAPEMGNIQLRRANVPEDKGGLPNLPSDLDLGTNQAALAAAADLRSAGKF